MHRLKERPDLIGQRRIRKPAMRERIAGQQVAEFIVNARVRNGNQRQERKPERYRGEEDGPQDQGASIGE